MQEKDQLKLIGRENIRVGNTLISLYSIVKTHLTTKKKKTFNRQTEIITLEKEDFQRFLLSSS